MGLDSNDDVMEDFKALFRLAGYFPARFIETRNEYVSPDHGRYNGSWAIVQFPEGEIKIGWRYRVIAIDWSMTERFRGKRIHEFFKDDVTKDENGIHAWGYVKALDYLSLLRSLMMMSPDGLERAREHARALS